MAVLGMKEAVDSRLTEFKKGKGILMNVSEELIREVVKRVLAESAQDSATKEDFVKEKDPSGIIKIQTETVKCEPFKQDGVALKDVVTLEEAPRMGCGIMELDHTSFTFQRILTSISRRLPRQDMRISFIRLTGNKIREEQGNLALTDCPNL